MPVLLNKDRLLTCAIPLQRVVFSVAEHADVVVLCGRRGKADQDKAFAEGHSKVRWPNSKHNVARADGTEEPNGLARAVDLAPHPIDWKDRDRFILLAGRVLHVASVLGIAIRWGGDWNQNGVLKDERFVDLPHFELV